MTKPKKETPETKEKRLQTDRKRKAEARMFVYLHILIAGGRR